MECLERAGGDGIDLQAVAALAPDRSSDAFQGPCHSLGGIEAIHRRADRLGRIKERPALAG